MWFKKKPQPFTPAEYYYLYSATRGPDDESRHGLLKRHITARVRSILLGKEADCPGIYTKRSLNCDELEAINSHLIAIVHEKRPEASPQHVDAHFISHLLQAVHVSANHPIWGDRGYALCTMLQRTLAKLNS